MKKLITLTVIALAFAFGFANPAAAEDFNTLRGADVMTDSIKSEVANLVETKKWDLAFRQQPPLIPHVVEKYEIDLKVNQCIRCHDWRNAAKENAPEVSKNHYVDRNGEEWDEVTRGRWFCTQCHVAQTDAKPLVENTFQTTGAKK